MSRNKSRKQNNNKINTIIIALIIVVISLFIFSIVKNKSNEVKNIPSSKITSSLPTSTPTPTSVPIPEPIPDKRVSFSASGDSLIHDTIYLQAKKLADGVVKQYDFTHIFANVKDFLSNYDINFLNQETLVNDAFEPSSYPMFSTPVELGQASYDAGYNVFSLSNNHSYDKGALGISATLEFWGSMPQDILYMGFYNDDNLMDIKTNTVNGITFSYVACTDTTNGLPHPQGATDYIIYTSQLDVLKQQIEKAKEISDFVIVSAHWGIEYSLVASDNQKYLAQELANYGADVIIGTHPHVIQPIEWITANDGTQTLCVYSLGNFTSAQNMPNRLIGQILTFDTVVTENDKYIENVQSHPIVTHRSYAEPNITTYLLEDYTDEMARSNISINDSNFNLEYIKNICSTTISSEFLQLP